MKEIGIETERRPISSWLPRENGDEVVYLTRGGRLKFVVIPLDEMDEEVIAIRKNSALMAYIDKACERARKQRGKPIEQVRKERGIPRQRRKQRR